MAENFDFEIVQNSQRGIINQGEISHGLDKLSGTIADNFERILDLAVSVAETKKMQAQADAYTDMLREQRQMLEAETDAYVKKLSMDTNATVTKVDTIRGIMSDYYASGQSKLSGEEFSKIISAVLDKMWEK